MTRGEYGKSDPPLQGLSICFDLDGTLVDTALDLVRVTNQVIALEGLPETDYRKARAVVGLGSRKLISDALERGGVGVKKERLDALQSRFLELYADDIAQRTLPFRGVRETLKTLTDLGADLSVCTNKPGWLARPLIEELGMTGWFSRIVGGDDAPRAKPNASHVFAAAGHREGHRIAMVGDSLPDMLAARNAGAFAVLMTYGYTDRPQKRLRADARLRTFRELTPTLLSWYGGRD